MKRLAFCAFAFFVFAAVGGEPMWVAPDGAVRPRLPKTLQTAAGVLYPAAESDFVAAGWRQETAEEVAEREAAEEAARHSMPLTFTKRALCKVLAAQGMLGALQSWLSANPAAEFWWLTAQDLSTDDEDFVAAVAALQAATGLTDAEVRALEEAAAWGMGAE